MKLRNGLVAAQRVLLVVVGLSSLNGCQDESVSDDQAEKQPEDSYSLAIPVETMTLKPQPIYQQYQFAGVARASQQAVIRTQISGRIETLSVQLGQEMKKGELIAELNNPEAAPAAQSARVRWQQLNVQLEQQQRDFDRIEALYEGGQASRQEFEQSRTALNSAKDAALAAENDYLKASGLNNERIIRAPFSGVVTAIISDIGEVVSPGQALVEMAALAEAELEITVPSQLARALQVGQKVEVSMPLNMESDSQEQTLTAKVKEVSPYRDRGALPTVVLALANVPVGETVEAMLSVPNGNGWVLPVTAIVKRGSGAVVYKRNQDGHVTAVPVEPGSPQGTDLQVTGQLHEGDEIVVLGGHRLFDDANVQVVP
ncbi:MAG: efflux RND transporter periplasmic adaptor subunit [Pseudomonadota bacterium]|nr:efflux RND transporter periplasmic adaptor subunit [Pseudomonadota bacterium]